MSAPSTVLDLVRRFESHQDAYKSGSYNETQLRRDFLDPFFRALGWDVDNEKGYAETYREVVHEDAIKIGGSTKAPDYSFRVGGVRKFFVEAKKPSVCIKGEPGPAFQLRRYAWSAKLPVSILTDFEELSIYDCRLKPSKNDQSAKGRIRYLTFKDYPEHWNEIADTFSKESILKGGFDKYVDESKGKRGTQEGDDEFLKEIESWRLLLARNIALRNPSISQRELNFAVQRTIDRIVFLRICEDRGIEEYGQLLGQMNGNGIYGRLKQIFRNADDRYNSGLFHFKEEKGHEESPDTFTLNLEVDDDVLKKMIGHLYYPDSPFEFSVLPSDLLGHVYEQFLGKVIRLTPNHQAKIEDKPEVRKSGGVYYTPTYIVDYIVQKTLGKLLDGKTTRQAANLRIVDPACGSGSFLLGAYQYLLDWYRDQYINDGPDQHSKQLYQNQFGDWRLTTTERKKILLDNLYGVDIDSQAVEVTKLSLLLKVLEGETEQTLGKQLTMFRERALPDLSSNIKCGNSLIGSDYYLQQQMHLMNEEEKMRVNVFDWTEGFSEILQEGKPGFDAVIGNPPYDVLEKDRNKSSLPHEELSGYAKTNKEYKPALGGKLNLYRFFIIRSMQILKQDGRFGMIIPLSFLADISCANIRKYILQSNIDIQTDCFPQKDNPKKRVFRDAKLSTMILTSQKHATVPVSKAGIHMRIYPWNSFKDDYKESHILLEEAAMLDPKNVPIPLVNEDEWKLCVSLYSQENVKRLGDITYFDIRRGEINQTIYREFILNNNSKSKMLKGAEIGRYYLREKLSQGEREWFDEEKYLHSHRPNNLSQLRRIATQRITGVDERLRIVATIVDPPCYFADSTNSLSVHPDSPYTLEYLLGLLNSSLFQWRFKLTSTNNNVGTNELESMPFREIDFSNSADKKLYDNLVQLVKNTESLSSMVKPETPHEKESLQRQIQTSLNQIDRIVYELYDLSEEEIQIVNPQK